MPQNVFHSILRNTTAKIIWYSTLISTFDTPTKWHDPHINQDWKAFHSSIICTSYDNCLKIALQLLGYLIAIHIICTYLILKTRQTDNHNKWHLHLILPFLGKISQGYIPQKCLTNLGKITSGVQCSAMPTRIVQN